MLSVRRSRPQDRPGANFLELFTSGAPHEQTLKAAQAYFEGTETISILSQNPEKKSNTVRATALIFAVSAYAICAFGILLRRSRPSVVATASRIPPRCGPRR